MRYISPLRYPGGKARLAPFFGRVIEAQNHKPSHYAEPFAGGAGAALKLLVDGTVSHIHLNDLNPGIAALWSNVFQEGERFAEAIETAEVTIEAWHRWSDTYRKAAEADKFELGFATFFLNRTNRSGILDARPIGGFDQKGAWKIDARFNKPGLAERVRLLETYKDGVSLYELDGMDFLRQVEHLGDDLLAYVDPPYIQQGDDLYLHAFSGDAHASLARYLSTTQVPWILTYDVHKTIKDELYSDFRCARFAISHTAQIQHVGTEYVVFSGGLAVPDLMVTPNRSALLLS